MAASINRLDNGNIELKLTVPWSNVQSQFQKELDQAISETEVAGFRKGKAPREMVEPKLDKSKLYSQAIQALLPQVYSQAVKDNQLKPIIYPQIHLTKGEEGTDWEFTALTCEIPAVTLPANYREEISKLPKEPTDTKLERIIDHLRTKSSVKTPDLLVEEEANHRLASLIENITRLGLTTESYLQTRKLTPETLKAQTAAAARSDLEVEFILDQVRQEQKLENRKQTLDFLIGLV